MHFTNLNEKLYWNIACTCVIKIYKDYRRMKIPYTFFISCREHFSNNNFCNIFLKDWVIRSYKTIKNYMPRWNTLTTVFFQPFIKIKRYNVMCSMSLPDSKISCKMILLNILDREVYFTIGPRHINYMYIIYINKIYNMKRHNKRNMNISRIL